MPAPSDETAWVVRAQCGDREALELVLRSVQPRLHRYVARLTGSSDAPDVSEDDEKVLRNALDAVDRGRRWALVGLGALFIAMAIALAAMMAVAAHTGPASSDAFLLKTLYVASAAQMLFVARGTAALMFQFTRMMQSVVRALESK